MSYSHIDVKPVTGALGGEIIGPDLREPLDDAKFCEIKDALLEHLVIFFRDQDITPDQHIAFGRRFGELNIHPYIPHLEGHPEIIVLGSREDDPAPNTLEEQTKAKRNSNAWHTDMTYTAIPPMGSILHGVEIPESGGDTMFVNLYAAYEALSDKMQRFLSDLTAVHDIMHTKTREDFSTPEGLDQIKRNQRVTPAVEHPVIRTHPETKRKCLFVNKHFTSHIKDLSQLESDRLLNMLTDHINKPEFQCRFRWQPHSIAFWDNRCTQHYAVVDYGTRRTMHRVTVNGDKPY